MVWTQETYHRSVNYDRLGECSPEKDCLWWHWLHFDNLSGSHYLSQVNCESSVDVLSLWSLSWLVNNLMILMVVCQLSRDVTDSLHSQQHHGLTCLDACHYWGLKTLCRPQCNTRLNGGFVDHETPKFCVGIWRLWKSAFIQVIRRMDRDFLMELWNLSGNYWSSVDLKNVLFFGSQKWHSDTRCFAQLSTDKQDHAESFY